MELSGKENKMETILLTGSTGFVGSHIVDYFLNNTKDFNIKLLIRKSSDKKWIKHNLDDPRVSLVYANINIAAELAEVLQDVQYIIHSAALTTAKNQKQFDYVNALSLKSITQAALMLTNPLKKIILLSSQAVAGPSFDRKPIDENYEPKPVSMYGLSKFRGENILKENAKQIPITILRPSSVYGPRDSSFLDLFKLARKGLFLQTGSDDKLLSMVHVNDLVKSVYLSIKDEKANGNTYFVSDNEIYSWKDIKNILEKTFEKKLKTIPIPKFLAYLIAYINNIKGRITNNIPILNTDKIKEMTYPDWICSSDKIMKELDYKPDFKVEEGFKQTLEWYKNNKLI